MARHFNHRRQKKRKLITRLICIQHTTTRPVSPTIKVLLIKILFFFSTIGVFTCSKLVNQPFKTIEFVDGPSPEKL